MSLSGKEVSLVHMLRRRAESGPSAPFLKFLQDGERHDIGLTLGELDRRARGIAGCLRTHVSPGERAVLMFSAGAEFVAAFFGCLYAGVVAVPAFPPRNRRTAPRVHAILRDAEPRVCLTDMLSSERCRELVSEMTGSEARIWIETDMIGDRFESE